MAGEAAFACAAIAAVGVLAHEGVETNVGGIGGAGDFVGDEGVSAVAAVGEVEARPPRAAALIDLQNNAVVGGVINRGWIDGGEAACAAGEAGAVTTAADATFGDDVG